MTRNNNTPPPLLNQWYKNITAWWPESIWNTSALSSDFQNLVQEYGWTFNTNQTKPSSNMQVSYTQIKEKSRDSEKWNQEKQSWWFLSWLKGLFSRSEKTKEQAQQVWDPIKWEFLAERNNILQFGKNMIDAHKQIIATTLWMGRSGYQVDKNTPLWGSVKNLESLNFNESTALLRRVFGDWPATELLIRIDQRYWWNWVSIKRMIALWYHEWGLKFNRQNKDPRSGFNIGTFQIGWARSNRAVSLKKYNRCFAKWVELAAEFWIDASKCPKTWWQADLMTHLWYIDWQRWWESTFQQLANPNLNDKQVVHLMSRKIQGWISAIGKSVVSQMKYAKIDTNFA